MINRTWREQTLFLKPNATNDVYFKDTRPNNLMIQNLSANYLYVSLNNTVNADVYEIKVAPNSSGTYSNFNGFDTLYIYNDGTGNAHIKITSYEGAFTADFLAQNMTADMVLGMQAVNTNLQIIANDILMKRQGILKAWNATNPYQQGQFVDRDLEIPATEIAVVKQIVVKSNAEYTDGVHLYIDDFTELYMQLPNGIYQFDINFRKLRVQVRRNYATVFYQSFQI